MNDLLDDVIEQLPAPQGAPAPPLAEPVAPEALSAHGPDELDEVIGQLPPPPPQVEQQQAAEDQQRKGDLLRFMVRSDTRAPEEQAEIIRLSIALGEHPETVAGDLPWARREVDARQLDTEAVLRAHPALADFLGDPETASLARGDTARLTGLSYLLGGELDGRKVPGVVEQMFKGRDLARDILEKQRELMNGGDPALREVIRKKERELEKLHRYGDGIEELGTVGKLVAKTGRIAVEMGPEMAKGAGAAALGALAGGVGAFATGTAFWAYETAPSMYWQLSELKDREGNPLLSEQESKVWAHAAAIPLGAANALTLEGLGASFTKWGTSKPIIERGLTKLLPEAAKRLTTAPGYGYAVGRLVGNYGTHLGEAGIMMGLDAGIQQATLESAKATHGADASVGAVSQAFTNGVMQGMEDFSLIAGWGPARRMLSDHGRIRASIEGERILRDIGENVRESKLAQRSPEKFAELMEKFGPDRKVYVDRKAFDEIAVKEKTTGRELAAEIFGDEGKAYDSATEAGADLAIPAAKWGEKVVRPGLDTKLLQDARFNLEDLTPNQRVVEQKRVAKEMEERAKLRGPAFEKEVADLRAQLEATANATGHKGRVGQAWAEKLSAYAANMSLRMDVGLRDAMVRVGLPQLRLEGREVLGHLLKTLEVTPEEKAAVGLKDVPVAQRDVVKDLGEGEAAKTVQAARAGDRRAQRRLEEAAYREPLTGLLNRAAFEDYKQGRGSDSWEVAIDANDLGAQDLFGGHETGDKLLTTVAEAMRAAGGNARLFRWGGDEFHAGGFKSQAEAKAFAVALKEKLAAAEDVAPGYRASVSIGVGPDVKTADRATYKAKASKKAKHGGFNKADPEAFRPKAAHGESFIYELDKALVPEGEVGVAVIEGAGVVSAKLAQGDRGTIRMRLDGKGKPVSFNIEALKGDKTTLAHETSHFLGWSLHKLATEKHAPESIVRDYQTLLDFGGWKDAETRAAENLERAELEALAEPTVAQAKRLHALTAKEEKIAGAWELYLREGKAPSAELRPLFTRYRAWMNQTYKGLAGPAEQHKKLFGQDLAISPEVRGVFDRMLASDDLVERARAEENRRPMQNVVALTPAEQDTIARLRELKSESLREDVDQAIVKDGAKMAGGAFGAARERIRNDVHADVSSEPVYMARDFLLSGELRDPNTGKVFAPDALPAAFRSETGPLRLSRAEAVKLVGEERAKLLDQQGYLHKEGAKPDEMAALFSFDDGKTMLDALIDAPERDVLVEQETQARFEDAFGPELVKHQAALEAFGSDAMHSPADILEALVYRDALAREIGSPGRLEQAVLKRNAERIMGGTRHAEISPKHHLDAERKGAARAFELAGEALRARNGGKLDKAEALYREALHEWDGVLLSKVLYREATKALDRVERNRAKLDKAAMTTRTAALGKADPSMSLADANASILASVGVTEDIKPRASHIDSALAVLKNEGGPTAGIEVGENGTLESVFWDAQLLRDLADEPRHWDLLTVDEGEHVVDAVEQMRKAASHKNKLTVGDKKMAREEVIDATRESSAHLKTAGEPFSWKGLGLAESVFHVARKAAHVFDSRLTDTEALVDRLTGNDRSHPLWEFVIGEKLKARDVELKLNDQFTHKIAELWKEMPAERRKLASKVAAGAIEDLPLPLKAAKLFDRSASRLTHGDLWMIALNLGNPGNKQRLLDGYGWTEKQVHETLAKHLTSADWKWVQGIWDSLGELYPHLERVHVEDTGLRPEKVHAESFKVRTADGQDIEVAGGYFPAKYDRRVPSKRMIGERQAAATVEQLMGPNYRAARTNTSNSKARALKNDDLIDITSFNLVPSHVATVVHDISHRLYVKELASLVLNEDFQSLVRERLGQEYDNVFRFWAQDVASTSSVANALEPVNKLMSFAKSRVTLAAVGFNIAVPIADLTNPLLPVTSGELSAKYLAHSTRQLATHWRENRDFALQHSGELALRARHANSLGIETQGLPLFSGKVGAYDAQVQRAAYWMMEFSDSRTATTVWLAKYNELTDGGRVDHKTAVRDADALIRRYFPSNDPVMKAAWLRDRGIVGYLTFLHGFGNKVYNMNRRSLTAIMDAMGDSHMATADKAKQIGWAMSAIVGQMALVGVIGEFLSGRGPNEDKDEDAGWLGGRALDYAGYQFPLTNAFFGGSRGALPVAGLIGKVKAHIPGVGQDEGPVETAAFWGMLGAGAASGVNQATKTAGYLDKGFSRDLKRGRYAHALSGAVYGDRGMTNPITAVGSALGEE